MSAPPSKTPPRFVPTLTDVVAVDAVQAPVQAVEPPAPLAHPVSELPLTDEATPWASEGMLAPRRGVVTLPASLPPLPQDLEPQRPMVTEQAAPGEIPAPAMQPVLSDYQPPSAPSVEMQLAQEGRLAEMADVADAAEAAGAAGAADVASAGDVAPAGEVVPADLVVPVVQAVVAEAAAAPTPASPAMPAAPTMESIWDSHAQQVTEEYLVHRLMQRVDLVLDQRLRDAIATVVQQQTRSIVVRLREEVESVVRQAVYEAVADELAFRATAARGDSGQGSR